MSVLSQTYTPFFSRLIHADINNVRAEFLFLALVIYAFAGSPTPDHPGWAEVLAGPIAIDVFLYASFKSLDFGLVLMLIPACLIYEHDKQARRKA